MVKAKSSINYLHIAIFGSLATEAILSLTAIYYKE